MLVLLVIFMLTTPLFQRGVDVDLPRTEASNTRGEERIIITIPKDKAYLYINDQPVNRALMERSIQAILRRGGHTSVYLLADKGVPYGEVMHVMDLLKKAGVETVGLATEPPPKRR